jgi:hypothetical protein
MHHAADSFAFGYKFLGLSIVSQSIGYRSR